MTEALAPEMNLGGDRAVAHGAHDAARRRATRRYVMSAALQSYLARKYLGCDRARVAGMGAAGPAPASSLPELRAHLAGEGVHSSAGIAHSRAVVRVDGRTMASRALAAVKIGVLGLTLALFALLAFVGQAHADGLVLAGGGQLFSGTLTQDYAIAAPSAGTLDIQLEDFQFPTSLSSLVLSLTNGNNVLLTMSGAGQEQIGIGAGTYDAHLFAMAGGSEDWGSFGFLATFEPPAPVPLPASLCLLLAGLATLAWSLRRQRGASTRERATDLAPSPSPATG